MILLHDTDRLKPYILKHVYSKAQDHIVAQHPGTDHDVMWRIDHIIAAVVGKQIYIDKTRKVTLEFKNLTEKDFWLMKKLIEWVFTE